MNFGDERLPALFWNKLSPCPVSGCWIWIGCVNRKGYGSHGRPARHSGSRLTHRFAYEVAVGALPSGTELDHASCNVRSCVNPAHMEAVPHAVNVGRAKRSHCKRGHELSGDNLMPTARGTRCRTCAAQWGADRHRINYRPVERRPRPRKTHCVHGHEMRFTGRRMCCDECGRQRGQMKILLRELRGAL